MTLKEVRKAYGLTMKDVASEIGVSESLICLIEKGKRRPSVRIAKRLSKLYGLKWEDFYREVT